VTGDELIVLSREQGDLLDVPEEVGIIIILVDRKARSMGYHSQFERDTTVMLLQEVIKASQN